MHHPETTSELSAQSLNTLINIQYLCLQIDTLSSYRSYVIVSLIIILQLIVYSYWFFTSPIYATIKQEDNVWAHDPNFLILAKTPELWINYSQIYKINIIALFSYGPNIPWNFSVLFYNSWWTITLLVQPHMPLRSCIFTLHMKETYITWRAHDFSLVSVCNSLSVITKVFTTSSAGRPLQRFRVWKNKIRYITQQRTHVTRFSKVTVFVESKGYTKKTIKWTEWIVKLYHWCNVYLTT